LKCFLTASLSLRLFTSTSWALNTKA
jgi:hypothetical protein